MTSQRSRPGWSSSASCPRLLGPRARKLAGRAPSCPRSPGALEGAGPGGGGSAEAPPGAGYRASRVGEFKESEDWSPLLLLLR